MNAYLILLYIVGDSPYPGKILSVMSPPMAFPKSPFGLFAFDANSCKQIWTIDNLCLAKQDISQNNDILNTSILMQNASNQPPPTFHPNEQFDGFMENKQSDDE